MLKTLTFTDPQLSWKDGSDTKHYGLDDVQPTDEPELSHIWGSHHSFPGRNSHYWSLHTREIEEGYRGKALSPLIVRQQ